MIQINNDSEVRLPGKYPPPPSRLEPKQKSLAIAIGLNVLWPGAGYLYFGRQVLGITLMIILPIFFMFFLQMILVFWVIMIIDLLVLNQKNKTQVEMITTRQCPFCAELIKRDAKVCRYCGRDI